MAAEKKTTKSKKKKLDVKVKMIGELIDVTGSSKDSWNPAEISDDMKAISYIRKLADTWNPAQLNEALKYLGFKTVDTWNPAELEETKNKLVKYFLPMDASGNPIELDLKGSLPYEVTSLTIDLLPIQDLSQGDPSPTNICPISGRTEVSVTRTGKNLMSPLVKGVGLVANTGVEQVSATSATTDYIPIKFTEDVPYYYISGLSNQINSFIYGYNANKQGLGRTSGNARTSIMLDKNFINGGGTPQGTGEIAYIRITQLVITGQTATIDVVDSLTPQLEIGQTETDYEAYQGETVTVQLGQNVYGGKLDVTNGKLTIDTAFQQTTWGDMGTGTSLGDNVRKSVTLSATGSRDLRFDSICNIAPYKEGSFTEDTNKFMMDTSGTTMYVYAPSTTDSTQSVQICYPLETPIEITLTAEQISLLKGQNVISADGDNINITYKAILNS